MKVFEFAAIGLFLPLAAGAQSSTPAPAASQSSAPMASSSPKLSTLGGDAVKAPEHPLTADQAKELYSALGYQKQIDENLQTMLTTQKTRAPFIPVDFWDDLESSFKKIDYSTSIYDVYKRSLSTEDAAKVIEFSKTEAGKHFLENVPTTSREVQQAVQKQQQSAGQEVQAKHKDEIEAALKKYRDEHQPKPAPSLGPTTGGAAGSASPGASGSSAPATKSTSPSGSTTTTPPATPPSTTPQN